MLKKKKAVGTGAKPTAAKPKLGEKKGKVAAPEKRKKFSMKRGANIMQNRKTSGDFFNMKNGKASGVVVLPVGESSDFFCVEQHQFYVQFKTPRKSADGKESKGVFITSPLTKNEDAYCVTSRCFDLMKHSASPRMKVLAKRFELRKRYLMNFFLQEKGPDGEITYSHKIGQFPFTVFQSLWQQIQEEMEDSNYDETGDPKDIPIVGDRPRRITITKEGEKLSTTYTVVVSGKEVPISKLDMSKVIDLYSVITITPDDEAEQIMLDFFGVDSLEDIEALAAGESVKTKGGKKKSKPATSDDDEDDEDEVADEDEDEDEDDADEEEEDAEDEDAEDDEDEDEDADEGDEEEEAPIPDCFGEFDKKQMKKRGCAKCPHQKMCRELVADADDDAA